MKRAVNLSSLPTLILFLATCVLCTTTLEARDQKEFSDYYELEPYQVTGEEIPITVFARNGGDRAYAARFAHKVVEVAYATLERSPGSGLVIIGRSREPHPITLFERFMEKAKAEGASPELKKIAAELEEGFASWREKLSFNVEDEGTEVDIDTKELVDAFPMPLPQTAARLYLLAWKENFDPERVELLLSELKAEDLKGQEFQDFKWVFYLPPRNSLNKVLKEVLPLAFEEGELGPVKRMLARAAIAAFKPLIKDAVEGVRKGILYWSVLSANPEAFNEGDIQALASVYISSQMPRGKILGSNKIERGLEAVALQKQKNAEYAKDPYIAPEPLENFDPNQFTDFLGHYGAEGHAQRTLTFEGNRFFWQKGENDPVELFPAGEYILVTEDRNHTMRFIPGETSSTHQVELRRVRYRHTYTRVPELETE